MKNRRVRHVLLFLASPLISAVVPLLLLPSLTGAYGASGWANLAVGQSLGLFGSVLVELGWGLSGPQRVAREPMDQVGRLFSVALASKILMFTAASPVVFVVALLAAPGDGLACAVCAVGACASGLSMSWMSIGLGKPTVILASEALPKLVTVPLLAVGILAGWPQYCFGVWLFAMALVSPVIATVGLGVWSQLQFVGFSTASRELLNQRLQLSARTVSATYLALPVFIVGGLSPPSLPVFAAAERLARTVLAVGAVIPTLFQGAIGRATPGNARSLLLTALGVSAGFAILSGSMLMLNRDQLSVLLFSGSIGLSLPVCLAITALVFVTSISRCVGGLALVRGGHERSIFLSAVVGAILVLPCLVAGVSAGGHLGGLLGLCFVETAVLAYQFNALWKRGWSG